MGEKISVLILVRRTFDVDLASLSRVDVKDGHFSHLVSTARQEQIDEFASPYLPTTCCATVVRQKEPLLINAASQTKTGPQCPMMKAEGYEAYLGVPIWLNGAVVGALEVVARTPMNWGQAEIDRLSKFGKHVQDRLQAGESHLDLSELRLVQ
jgi:GAF domain-containing protein